MSTSSSYEIYSFTLLNEIHKKYILELWNNEYPIQLAFNNSEELEKYLQGLIDAQHLFIVDENNQIKGWAVVFEKDYEKWFAIIISNDLHRKGIGSKLLDRLKMYSDELNGWVIDHENDVKANGENYLSPLSFYNKNEFIEIPETRLESEIISAVKIKWEIKKRED
ncbi:GNAT family N-acetyltransferase [Chishuiella sp.]|uniref:GNAT family N-acetyltransferase n=1 Tax=Chishuiella sp. TaxID=1969467 RepID=UPI0028AC8AFE|nr:GNAT family N-acetyltransferase [Chishuiella sp.]